MSNIFITDIVGSGTYAIPTDDTELAAATAGLDALISGVANLTYDRVLAWVEDSGGPDGAEGTRTLNCLIEKFTYLTVECPSESEVDTMVAAIESALEADANITSIGIQQVHIFQVAAYVLWNRDSASGFLYPNTVTDDVVVGGNVSPTGKWFDDGDLVLGGNTMSGTEKLRVSGSQLIDTNGQLVIADSATIAPFNITERSIAPSSPSGGDIYLDDGSNTASGNPGWRRYDALNVSWEDISAGGGGGGNDSYPDIDQWITVDKTSGSYTPDGTIQFPENSIANAITIAAAMTPSTTNRIGIKLMPGHYTEADLDLPSYVYLVGESREACVITNVAANQLVVQTNPHVGFYRVSFERTGNDFTTGFGVQIGNDDLSGVGAGVDDVLFDDVIFDFDMTYGIMVWGATSASTVKLRYCSIAGDYDPAGMSRARGHLFISYSSGSQDHIVEFDQCFLDGESCFSAGKVIFRHCNVDGAVFVADVSTGSLGDTDADAYFYQTTIECLDFDQPSRFFEGSLSIRTTGNVFLNNCVLLGGSYTDGCSSYTNYPVFVLTSDTVPNRWVCSETRFGYELDTGGGFSGPDFSIYIQLSTAPYVSGVFNNCTFDIGVYPYLINAGQVVFPCGTGQMYNTAANALTAARALATNDLIIRLMDDSDAPSQWLNGQRITLDLNGFRLTGSNAIFPFTNFMGNYYPTVVVQNGTIDGGRYLLYAGAGITGAWDITFRNIEIGTGGADVLIIGGAAGAKIAFDNVRNWVGKTTFCMRIVDVDPEIQLRHCYLKGNGANEAVQFDTNAHTNFYAARCTFLHGSMGANNPFFANNTSTQGSADILLDYCRCNQDPTTDPNITLIAESAYNIFNATVDFLG